MAKKSSNGLIDFVKEQGVVGLAVGLAIGTSAGKAVEQIVAGFIDPIIAFILGSDSLSGETLTVIGDNASEGDRVLTFGWGAIVASIISLLATVFVIYYIVKKAGLDKLDK